MVNLVRAARDMYRHSLDIMRNLSERGVLDAEETPEVEAIARKVAECEAAMSL